MVVGSERLVAQAFRERPDLAGAVLVTTKVGHLPGHDGTYDMAIRCVEGSMERLGVQRFPLLYIHDPMDLPMDLVISERGTLGALRTLQKRELVDYVGVAAKRPGDQCHVHRNRGSSTQPWYRRPGA